MNLPRKRLFICCDGTGRDSIREKNEHITNVARFARCIQPVDGNGVLQLVYYHNGVGLHNGEFQYREAATGQGIHGVIQDAYYYLCLNFSIEDGRQDEIHLVGFSRGAFAVRALACFIHEVGILSRTRLALSPMIYSLWRKRDLARLKAYLPSWEAKGHVRRNVDITSCGVWDTVSAMIPASDLAFVSDAVPSNLRYAWQALALHETRNSFFPVLWSIDASAPGQTNIKQCWLAGDHSDIGGGHPDAGISTISFLWMVAQYKEYTHAGVDEVMLLDCMTPLFLHWQEKAFLNWEEMTLFNKEEYLMQNHVFTKGNVHGPEHFATALWRLPGQSSIVARESVFIPMSLAGQVPTAASTISEKVHDEKESMPASIAVQPDESNQQNGRPSIHFTVRILMSARKQECHLLLKYSTITRSGRITWADVTRVRGFFEEEPTAWETWMFRQWIKREEELFGKDLMTSAENERLTRFLYPYRREGDRPRKAFYSPAPRASSTDRSRKIKDANDMVAEAAEKGPDLSQSRSSAATSVGSGVKYYLDLDLEGSLPERFGRAGSAALARRELQLDALYLSRRPTLQRQSS
ncbi:uncharacterized protein N0V89_010724 [Didymosphaeria variabile]|uniref:T6SS Phospholipase effector Tle1-like catalytic domain-containing protein n=1 Tax=Didymosphaeria variabile TaxID=1932322 RepID=A0A9W9C7E8_9PLEO|nr:uncharacterized protein N0V89_010724 [Didymosphaeria variabile]KAJ4346792.1 hypothetical protein N0V89_010724 [Didymosphaeria variabile]